MIDFLTGLALVGAAPAAFSWLNENYGECETKTAMLKPALGSVYGKTADEDLGNVSVGRNTMMTTSPQSL